jgi:hypothetical protein
MQGSWVISVHYSSLNGISLLLWMLEQSLIASAGGVMEGKSNSHSSTIVSSNSSNAMCVAGASNSSNSNNPSVGVPLTPTLDQVRRYQGITLLL